MNRNFISVQAILSGLLLILPIGYGLLDPETENPNRSVVEVYQVEGEDQNGRFSGLARFYFAGEERRDFTAVRELDYTDGSRQCFIGIGRRAGGFNQIVFEQNSTDFTLNTNDGGLTAHFEVPPVNRVEMEVQLPEGRVQFGTGISVLSESWRPISENHLKVKQQFLRARSQTLGWVGIPIRFRNSGLVKLSIRDDNVRAALLLPNGQHPDDDVHARKLVNLGLEETYNNRRALAGINGVPQLHTSSQGYSWLYELDDQEIRRGWKIWVNGAISLRPGVGVLMEYYQWSNGSYTPAFGQPTAGIEIGPQRVVQGQPFEVTISGASLNGLDQIWMFGNATGIPELDRAFTVQAQGRLCMEKTFSMTIDRPGTYSFGANARDLLYGRENGLHQASDACGLAYDIIEVEPEIRKRFRVGFVLFAPEGYDANHPEVRSALRKLTDIKFALTSQFERSTEGHGRLQALGQTFVFYPSGAIPDIVEDGSREVNNFVFDVLRDELYAHYEDDYDFLAVYEIYPDKQWGARHITIRSYVNGFGFNGPVDHSDVVGSQGRLRGFGFTGDPRTFPVEYDFRDSKMLLLLHELFGHQWGIRLPELQRGSSGHFKAGIESTNVSVMYARPWRRINDTTFETVEIIDPQTGYYKVTFHPWVLYTAGLKLRHEIPQQLYEIITTDSLPRYAEYRTVTGTTRTIYLDDMIERYGDRYDVRW